MNLQSEHFADFFRAVHKHDPYPWQQALVDRLAETDTWPDVLELPTGSGKTAALDAAVFHLALRYDVPSKAALRIVFVVDRRLVVDDAYGRAKKISHAIQHSLIDDVSGCGILRVVATRLKLLAGKEEQPLVVKRLRGGAPLENDWTRTPVQPTILCSTVDQVGSRLLFRGYGVSDRMKPVHAGLLGTNCLILLDEAHLAEPFQQTLKSISRIGKASIQVSRLSATPGTNVEQSFKLSPMDRTNANLKAKLEALKPALLRRPIKNDTKNSKIAANVFAMEAIEMADRLQEKGVSPVAVGVVVNRVALARNIYLALEKNLESKSTADTVLIIGRSRSAERNELVSTLAPFRTGEATRSETAPLFVVATQCLEVGVDLDLDGLVTQAASLDALRQRFGRLNRNGRPIEAEGAILAFTDDVSKRVEDPVYGDRICRTWEVLQEIAVEQIVDFGVEALPKRLIDAGVDMEGLVAARPDAPVVMPSYLDLWSQTSPKPVADPDIGLFLHGVDRTSAGVSIIWRSDISEADLDPTGEISVANEAIRLVPPRAAEAIEVPIWTARAWLSRAEDNDYGEPISDISDAPEFEATESQSVRTQVEPKKAFRWAGHDDPATGVVSPHELRIGDLLVVPAKYGGCDRFGWNPESNDPVKDVADIASKPYWGQRCAVRITPDIVCQQYQWDRIIRAFMTESTSDFDLLERLLVALPPEDSEANSDRIPVLKNVRECLKALQCARGRIKVRHPYSGGMTSGAVLVSERGLKNHTGSTEIPTTEDDAASHSSHKPVPLDEHGYRVKRFAEEFARILKLENVIDDLGLAALLHDAGKADPRFQIMLAGGDPWNRPDSPPLAKSGRSWLPQVWERSGLPKGWRHEALSVQMALTHPLLSKAHDPALVLWLIGSHHGFGRPFFNFFDPASNQPLPCFGVQNWQISVNHSGPQSFAFNLDGADWPSLYESIKRRYGIWGIAHLEAILRLADHRASEEERV